MMSLRDTIKVSLLTQLENGEHHTRQLWSPGNDASELHNKRVTEGELAVNGWAQ